MASIYDFTASLFVEHMLPPLKRLARYKSWLGVLLNPIQYGRDLFYNQYANGDYDVYWSSVSTHTKGQNVVYLDYQIYIAKRNVPIMTPCIDTNYWDYVSPNVGLKKLAAITGQKLLLEYVLNKHYGTTFRQPSVGTSDIYIEDIGIDVNYFVAGIDGEESSYAAISGENALQFVGESYTYDTEAMVIWVPDATLSAITQGSEISPYPQAKKVVLYYAYRFIFAGIIARVEPY